MLSVPFSCGVRWSPALRARLAVILVCAALTGCSKKDGKPESEARPSPAPASTPTAVEVSPAPSPTAVAPVKATPKSAVPASDFKGRLQEVEALENDTDFVNAIRFCEAMKTDFTDIGQLKTLSETLRRLTEEKRTASKLGLAFAVQQLGANDSQVRQAGERALEDAGEAGALFLRHAFRSREAPIAIGAGLLLARMGDTNAIPLFAGKLRSDPHSPIAGAAARGLVLMARDIDKGTLSACLEILRTDRDLVATNIFSVVEAVLVSVCNRDEKAFNEAVGRPDAKSEVLDYLGRAIVSSSPDSVAWACGRLPESLPMLDGLRACYYTGSAFETCVLDRREDRVKIGAGEFPLPDGRPDDFSARWIGGLLVTKPGDYVFHLVGRPRAQFWLDDKPVERTMTLAAGWHSLKIEYVCPGVEGGARVPSGRPAAGPGHRGDLSSPMKPGRPPEKGPVALPAMAKGRGDGSITFSWEDPGARLRTPPWPAALAELRQAMANLGASDAEKARAARKTLTDAGDVGHVYLRNAVRNAPAPTAAAAVALLVESGDKRSVGAIIERYASEKDAGLVAALADGLCAMVGAIEMKTLSSLYQAGLARGAEAMNPNVRILCAALVACGGTPAAFNTLVDDPNGYQALQQHVQAALASPSAPTARRACLYGAPFAPALPGSGGRPVRRQDLAAVIDQVEKAVADLSAAKPESVGAATKVLQQHGEMSLFFLRRALRAAPPAGVAVYVPVLVRMNDLSLTDVLRNLRKTQPPAAAAIDAALDSLTVRPDRDCGRWFYAVMKADQALEFPVSGKFLANAMKLTGNNEDRFNKQFAAEDPKGAANLKAYLDRLAKVGKR